ncbi:MAG TPA: energy-coupling factor transporter transmembrane component T [Candidatus Limnocylindrales bacterium]|nr:energy-coupling factor transporter transmembrane component T [Candidatus Limnocylindrales bacterium]
MHPWPKLVLLVWAALAPFVLPVWAIPVLLIVCLGVGATAGLGRPYWRTVAIGALVLGAPIVLLNGLVFPGARDVLVPLGPLAITREGLEFGLPVAGRLIAALAAVTAFVLSTRPDDLMESLIERGVSARLAFALLVALQAIPRLGRQSRRVVEGARTRGLRTSGSMRVRLRSLGPIVGALAVGTLVDVRDRTLALESRGFSSGARRTAYRQLVRRPIDLVATRLAVLLLLLLAVALGLRVAGLLPG